MTHGVIILGWLLALLFLAADRETTSVVTGIRDRRIFNPVIIIIFKKLFRLFAIEAETHVSSF